MTPDTQAVPDPTHSPADATETAAWYWFAYESGLALRRAKEIVGQHVIGAGQRLADILHEAPAVWELALGLSKAEVGLLEERREGLHQADGRVSAWQAEGIGLVRMDQPGYPATLRVHLRPEHRPLLLSYRGDLDLLELPGILPLAGEKIDEEATTWTVATMLDIAAEGALPLAVARPGLYAALVRELLAREAPLALVVAQGLAVYRPPAALKAAVDAGRALLLSPFQPVWAPPQARANPMLPHAATFAQALAHALILVSPPYPSGLTPEQPCFLRPGLPKTVGCQTYYEDPAQVFMQLIEVPAAAAAANAPDIAFEEPQPRHTIEAESPLDPDDLIERLSQLGHVPEAMKERLRRRQP
ncbi:MAG: hypothetical protein D6775_07850 [Caldilineae bacterium]|nr:MAG: hypothetical protein D6775_07850 [Caldilineae bacterium]